MDVSKAINVDSSMTLRRRMLETTFQNAEMAQVVLISEVGSVATSIEDLESKYLKLVQLKIVPKKYLHHSKIKNGANMRRTVFNYPIVHSNIRMRIFPS